MAAWAKQQAFGLPRERTFSVDSADCDSAGARSFGFQADVTGINLTDLPTFAEQA